MKYLIVGLGNIGAVAGKPVMEGKGLLFKVFADVDVFDIEIDKKDPKEFIEVAKSIAPTFGGINLEDIAAPACFEIEEALIEQLDFAGYFLIVWDIVEFCRRSNIFCQGRGSAANSAVCYCLMITAVDPIGMELLFERFL